VKIECFIELLRHKYKSNQVSREFLKLLMLQFMDLEYIKIVYSIISNSNASYINLEYVTDKLNLIQHGLNQGLCIGAVAINVLDSDNFKYYQQLKEMY